MLYAIKFNDRTNYGSIFQLFCVTAIWFDCRTQSNSIIIWVRISSIEIKFDCVWGRGMHSQWLCWDMIVFYMSLMQFAFPFAVNASPGTITLLTINAGLQSYTVWAITLIKVKVFDQRSIKDSKLCFKITETTNEKINSAILFSLSQTD